MPLTATSPFFFHVGMYRTATTTFQQAFFPRHPGIDYFGKPFPHPELDRLITAISCHDSSRYDAGVMRRIVAEHIEAKRTEGRVPVVSQELMASYGSTDMSILAQRLKDLFGECRIFISLRRQDSLLLSYYLQTAFKKYNAYYPLDKWLEREWRFQDYHSSLFHLLDYDGLVRSFEEVLGAGSVKALPFELFVRDMERYLTELCAFLGVSADAGVRLLGAERANASKGEGYQRAMRLRKAFLPWERTPRIDDWLVRCCSLLWRGEKPEVKLSEKWSDLIRGQYAESNRRLAERHGLDLEPYGYF